MKKRFKRALKRLSVFAISLSMLATTTFGTAGIIQVQAAYNNELAIGEDGQWHYYVNGAVDWNYTGLAPNEYGWFKITNGNVDFGYTGLAYDENVGWWYVENGAIKNMLIKTQ